MKKLYFVLIFFTFFGFLTFADDGEQEEMDYLLFLPNSSNQFADEEQAMIQLDNLARHLIDRNPGPGRVNVYGYTADVVNDIEPVNLSRDRALFVINELQKRGVSENMFADPIGRGSVDLWGSNEDEEGRSPNRRVRIMLDGNLLTPITLTAEDTGIKPPVLDDEVTIVDEPAAEFPWKILLALIGIALIAAIILLLSRLRKKSAGKALDAVTPYVPPEPLPEKPVIEADTHVAEPAAEPAAAAENDILINLEDEIRLCAYELYMRRNGQNLDPDGDWYMSVREISSRYEAAGYQVYNEAGCWWAHLRTKNS